MLFQDRRDAGEQLAKLLAYFYKGKPAIVYGLARGGMVVAAEVAKQLDAPLDVLIARKIGHPQYPEYAIGAVAETGKPVWDEAEAVFMSEPWRRQQIALGRQEARRQQRRYQGDQPRLAVAGKTAIVVDDGIATGLTMIAALRSLHYRNPLSIVVAVPVAPRVLSWDILRYSGARTYVLHSAPDLEAIGVYYRNFDQITDEEVRQLLRAYRQPQAEPLDLTALNAMLSTVTQYPVSNGQLLDQAQRLHAPANVVEFFESIPKDVQFTNKTDVMQRADETGLLMEQELHEPREILRDKDY